VPLPGKLCVCGVFEDLAVGNVHMPFNCVNFEIFLNNYSELYMQTIANRANIFALFAKIFALFAVIIYGSRLILLADY
jgi:hypothetical protein